MKLNVILILSVLFLTSLTTAGSGVDLIFKGGRVNNYFHPGMNLPEQNFSSQDIYGASIFISRNKIIDLIIGIDYLHQGRQYEVDGQKFMLNMRDIAATVSFIHTRAFSNVKIFAGAGFGSHSLAFDYYRPRDLSLEDNDITIPEISTYFGYHAVAGFKIDMSSIPIGLYMEGRINRINLPDENIKYNSISVGLYLNLP